MPDKRLGINQYELDNALQREVGEHLKELSRVIESYGSKKEENEAQFQEEISSMAKRLERLDAKAEIAMTSLEAIANSLETIAELMTNRENVRD